MPDDPELTPEQQRSLVALWRGLKSAGDYRQFNRREFFVPYAKQREFFALGSSKRERMFNAGNQLGKSDSGAYETQAHLTGDYPPWWTGKRFDRPILAWACGLTAPKTMDICQGKLCGKPNTVGALGTGLIPLDRLAGDPVLSRGTTGAFATVPVKHAAGGSGDLGISTLAFKAYEQGWQKFQSDGVHFAWLDEEPDDFRVYTETQARMLATRGSIIVTFTPLNGETELYASFASGTDPSKGFVNMTGDDVLAEPHSHLTRDEYERQIAGFPIHEQAARRSGQPIMGSGMVFPLVRESIECPAIQEPLGHWRSGWGVDFGGMGGSTRKFSHPFGAVLLHYDPLTDVLYVAHALQLRHMMPMGHASAMKSICAAAPVFWPHDGHRTVGDDSPATTADLYRKEGLRMYPTHATFPHGGYATETGILEMYQRFTSGRLKVVSHLREWWDEFLNYHRDETGQLVKVGDDLMSATRMAVMMVPRFGVHVPMGSLDGSHWRDYNRRNRITGPDGVQMAAGLDYDVFNPTGV